MKKILLSVLLVTGFALSSRAQKRSFLVYGIVDIHSEKEANDDKTTKFSIHPGVGYQFSGLDGWNSGRLWPRII